MTRTETISYCTGKLGIADATATAKAGEFYDARWSMLWNEEDWRQTRYQETVAVTAGTQDITLGANCEFVKACRWAGTHELLPISDVAALATNPAGYDTSGPVLGFVPLGKTSAGLVQIRLMQIPAEAKNLLVIGKRKVLALAGSDTPPIPGADQVLNEWVMGDLYEWLRQMTKAQYFFQKGGILLQKMKDIETQQAAEIRRIIPLEQQLDGHLGGDSFNPLSS
jgi:hypothetical protein